MAEAAEKLNITGLTVFFGGSFAMGLDKVVKPYITRHSFNKGGLLDRNMLKYRLLRRFL